MCVKDTNLVVGPRWLDAAGPFAAWEKQRTGSGFQILRSALRSRLGRFRPNTQSTKAIAHQEEI